MQYCAERSTLSNLDVRQRHASIASKSHGLGRPLLSEVKHRNNRTACISRAALQVVAFAGSEDATTQVYIGRPPLDALEILQLPQHTVS